MEKLNFVFNKAQKDLIVESLKDKENILNVRLRDRQEFIEDYKEIFKDPKKYQYDPVGDPHQWDAVQRNYKKIRKDESMIKQKLIYIDDLKNILK